MTVPRRRRVFVPGCCSLAALLFFPTAAETGAAPVLRTLYILESIGVKQKCDFWKPTVRLFKNMPAQDLYDFQVPQACATEFGLKVQKCPEDRSRVCETIAVEEEDTSRDLIVRVQNNVDRGHGLPSHDKVAANPLRCPKGSRDSSESCEGDLAKVLAQKMKTHTESWHSVQAIAGMRTK